ncbi:MAG: hypothetical protein J6T10_30155 [Methanobrevibacter sp.]|nr:hypothetical protein [Methanobrevibacter sp.]
MTRINVIPVEELSDQHLIAEYRELPRALKWKGLDISNAPDKYCLGVGHIKWGRKHWVFCFNRYKELVKEMEYRGFNPLFKEPPLDGINTDSYGYYIATPEDYKLNIKRIKERYLMKPDWYRWTKRVKPDYLKGI